MFNDKQKDMIMRLMPRTLDFQHLSDDDFVEIEERVGDRYHNDALYGDQDAARLYGEILDILAR